MSLLVPLYVHPAEDPGAWHRLIASADRTYAVVLNPADGPGSAPDPAYTAAARALRAAGARLLGYVDTDYGVRDRALIVEEARRHQTWYAADGCFLDRVTAGPEGLSACRRTVRELRRLGTGTVVLNPGVHPAPGYARLADLTVT
ncbi:spherulation-specific family 4 protein, partial [Streptomyces tricolor]